MNASVAGREKNVKKVISFPYSCNKDILYSQMVTVTVMHDSKVTDLNLDYTLVVFLPFWETGSFFTSTFLNYSSGAQLGLGKVIQEVTLQLSAPPL